MTYHEELCQAMGMLAGAGAVFVGQAVAYPGTSMYGTLRDVPESQRHEFPVAEDAQLGYCIGRAIGGELPVCIYPRFSFLLLATNQLVLGLDKLPLFSACRPRVIIRTAIPTPHPMDPGPQHLGDFTYALREMLQTVAVVRLDDAEEIVPQYRRALQRLGSTLLIERTALYA